MTMTMNGTVNSTATDMHMLQEMTNPANPSQKATIEMQVATNRTAAECSPELKAQAEET